LLSLARREPYQCNARHKSDGNDLEFGFHIRRNYFPPRCSQPEIRKTTETRLIPDEIHDLLRWSDWVRAYRATAEFFDRKLAASG